MNSNDPKEAKRLERLRREDQRETELDLAYEQYSDSRKKRESRSYVKYLAAAVIYFVMTAIVFYGMTDYVYDGFGKWVPWFIAALFIVMGIIRLRRFIICLRENSGKAKD